MKKVQTGLQGVGSEVVFTPIVEIGEGWGLSLHSGRVVSFGPCDAAQDVGNDEFGATLNGRRQAGFSGREVTAQWEYADEIKAARRRLEDRVRKDPEALARAYAAVFDRT